MLRLRCSSVEDEAGSVRRQPDHVVP